MTEYLFKPSLSSLADNSKETGVLEFLPTVWDIKNDMAFGLNTNAASSKQQSHAELDRTTAKQRKFMRRWYKSFREREALWRTYAKSMSEP